MLGPWARTGKARDEPGTEEQHQRHRQAPDEAPAERAAHQELTKVHVFSIGTAMPGFDPAGDGVNRLDASGRSGISGLQRP